MLRIDDKKFSVTINLYFGVLWDEIRLDIGYDALRTHEFEHASSAGISLRLLRRKAAGDVSWLPIDINFLKQLWLPNVYVYDLVSFNPLECLEKLAGLWVVQKKEIFYNLVRAAIA